MDRRIGRKDRKKEGRKYKRKEGTQNVKEKERGERKG